MLVEETRGSTVENRHRVHAAVIDATGARIASVGDPRLVTFWRSGAKPFQALPIVADGAADAFGITEAELALCCASHSSEPAQVQGVRDVLARIGCSERDLLCGPHPPLSTRVAQDYAARGVRVTAVFSNCSGNHAGMLAVARRHGWPVEDYTHPEHPVQQRCVAEVSEWTGVPGREIGIAIDGCGVVCFALPLEGMAYAYAQIGSGDTGGGSGSGDSSRLPSPASRIVQAMLRHPEMIAGEGRPCTTMMRAHRDRLITKTGAAGVYCAALIREHVGVALKIEDGNGAAAAVAIAAILNELGLALEPESVMSHTIFNTRGERVGELRVSGGLETKRRAER